MNMRVDRSKPSDDEIIRRILDGDVNAFEQLLVKYQKQVLKIVRKHIPYDQIEETAQDVFVRAYQSLLSMIALKEPPMIGLMEPLKSAILGGFGSVIFSVF